MVSAPQKCFLHLEWFLKVLHMPRAKTKLSRAMNYLFGWLLVFWIWFGWLVFIAGVFIYIYFFRFFYDCSAKERRNVLCPFIAEALYV